MAAVTDYRLLALDGHWDQIPLDRQEAVGSALRSAVAAAPVAGRDLRLGEIGCVLVSQRALDEYLHQTQGSRPEYERGRRQLTELCLDAKRVSTADRNGAERWRVRSRGRDVDFTLLVARDGRLCVVTSIGQVRRA